MIFGVLDVFLVSSFSEKPDISPDDKEQSLILTDDLNTLNVMIVDKINEIKRQREEIDQINKDYNDLIS